MPFDPTKPYETVAPPFDPSKPFEAAPRFDPSKAFEVVKGAGRDTSRDSYEAQLADLGLTEADAAEATKQSDKQADLLAAQRKAARQGEYQEGVINRIDTLTGTTVEPLTRPLSGALGRAADVVVPGPPIVEPTLQQGGIHLPRAGQAETTGGKIAAGTYNAAAELLSTLSSPDMVALLPAAANKAVLTAWISQMAGHQPERVLKAAALFKEGKTQEAVQEVATGVGELGLAELGRRHVMRDTSVPTMADVEGPARLRINDRGEVIDLANPDTIARNLAAPGTIRPQEQRAWAPPTLDPPADMVNFERVPIFNRKGEVVDVQVRPRIREIVIEDGGTSSRESPIIPVTRGAVREAPEGGKVSFAADAPVLNREALGPRVERVTELQREEPQLQTKEVMPRGEEIQRQEEEVLDRPAAPTRSEPTPPPEPANAPAPAAELVEAPRPGDTSEATRAEQPAQPEAPPERKLAEYEAIASALKKAYPFKGITTASEEAAFLAKAKRVLKPLGVPTDVFEIVRKRTLVPSTGGPMVFASDARLLRGLVDYGWIKPKAPTQSVPSTPARAVAKVKKLNADEARQLVRDLYEENFRMDPEAAFQKVVGQLTPEQRTQYQDILNSVAKRNEFAKGVEERNKRFAKPDTRPLELGNEEPAGLISGTALDKWANDVLRGGATHLGPDVLAAYVVRGAALMERGVRKFAEWSARMIAEHGDAIRPHLRAVFEESQRGLARVGEAVGESKTRMRKLSVRAGASRAVPGELKPQLKADPLSYYQQQNVKRGVDAVAKMTNAELEAVPETSKVSTENIKTLARFEQMKRLWAQADELQSRGDAAGAAAKRQAGYNVLTDLSQTLTSFGQLINQAKQMVGASPDMIVRMVNRKLQEAKQPVLRPAEEMVIRRLSEESIGANVRHRAAEDAWFETPTDANAEAVARAKDLANAADAHLRERLHRLQPRTFADTLVTLEQGSVQAPISLAANVSGNLGFLPMDPAARAVATGLDMVHALFRKGGREIASAPWSASVAGARSLGRGAQAAGRILARGAIESDLAADMAHQPLRPLIAWRDLVASAAAKMTGREQPPFARQRGILALEAMPQSMMASAVLRINAATDVMFREPIRARLITEAMKLRELKGRQRIRELEQNRNRTLAETQELLWLRNQTPATSTRIGQALKTPELFLDEATRSRIDNEARHAVFQGNNFLSSWVNWGLNQASPWGRFGLRQLALFVNTPTNFLGKMFSYMPVTGAVNTLRHALAGDGRAAKLAAGRMVVGTIYSAMALYLYKQGLISPSLSSPTDQQKERLMGQDFFPPGTLNVSGLARVKSGRSGAWRPGDRVVELNRLGGPGFLMLSMADIERAKEMRPPEEASRLEDAGQAVLAQLTQPGNYAVNQSFLKGTATGLNALLTGDFDKWAQSVEEGLVSIGLPNTLTAITRATRDAKLEVRGDSQLATLQNILKNRVAGVERLAGKPGSDVGLPVRRGLFGEPLPETPEGANPLVYQFFDITKGRTIPNDPVLAHVYGLYRKTGDSTVLPAPPDAHFGMFKQNFELTRQQVSDLQEQVGKARYTLARAIVDNPKFLDAPVDAQRAILKQAWESGNLFGKMRFAIQHRGELKEKGKPMGFEPAP